MLQSLYCRLSMSKVLTRFLTSFQLSDDSPHFSIGAFDQDPQLLYYKRELFVCYHIAKLIKIDFFYIFLCHCLWTAERNKYQTKSVISVLSLDCCLMIIMIIYCVVSGSWCGGLIAASVTHKSNFSH